MLSILKTNIKIVIVTGVITLLLCNASVFAQNFGKNRCIVNSFSLNIRKSPSLDSKVITVVKRGETLDIIGKITAVGDFLFVSYKGSQGYIRNRPKYIQIIISKPAPSLVKPKIKKTNKTKQITLKKKPQKEATQEKQQAPKKQVPTKQQPQVEKQISKKKQVQENKQVEEKSSQNLNEKIKAQKKMVESFSQREVEIIEGLNEIDYALNKARIKVTALSEEVMHLEDKIAKLHQERDQLRKAVNLNRDYAGERLKALYKMNMIGRLDSTGLPDSIFDFFLMQNSMKQIIKSISHIIDKQNQDLEKLEIVEQNMEKQIKAKSELEFQLTDQIRINKDETAKRKLVLKQIRQKKRLSLAAVESLKYAALKLDHEITVMQKKGKKFNQSKFSFSSYKGRLHIPVKGKIISKYGPSKSGDYKSFTFQKGIDIKVERGEPVKSVFRGEVMFAQWLKGYGNLLIINHGENYYTLYAHVEEVFKQKGESVETGEVIATAGDTGSIKGLCLHFEVRHHGKPVNPMEWLKMELLKQGA